MALIYETDHFRVQAAEFPLVDRADGGHITIDPKIAIRSRQLLSARQSIELMRLIAVAGEAMATVMQRNGVDIGRINYQDNGNWGVFQPEGPQFHYHLYGRARNAVVQPYGQSLYFPHKNEVPSFYARNRALTDSDVADIREEMKKLFGESRYADAEWRL